MRISTEGSKGNEGIICEFVRVTGDPGRPVLFSYRREEENLNRR
jgi:hypothetical protein